MNRNKSIEDLSSEGSGKLRDSSIGDMVLSHQLIITSQAAHAYLEECAAKHEELERIRVEIEIGLCTCVWLNS